MASPVIPEAKEEILQDSVQAWNALGPGHISKHSLSHTQMHNFLTQTINAGIPRQWQHNAKITFYRCNRTARASCWWQAETLTFFLWRRLGPWSRHSSPELLRVGGTAGVMLKERESNRKLWIRTVTSSDIFHTQNKMCKENAQQFWGTLAEGQGQFLRTELLLVPFNTDMTANCPNRGCSGH